MSNLWFRLILFLVLCQPCFSVYAQENISEFSDKTVPVLNDTLRSLNSNANRSKNLLNSYFTSGILDVNAGGTGQDFSTASADTLMYFDSTGHFGTVTSDGSTSKFLDGSFTFSTLPEQVRFVWENPLSGTTASCSGGACNDSETDIIDSSTDWSGKRLSFEGSISLYNTVVAPAQDDIDSIESTSATAVTGYPYAVSANDSKQVYKKFFWTASTTNKTLGHITGSVGGGDVTCDLDVNGSGQLVLVTTLLGTSGGGNEGHCRLDDVIIIRER